MKYILSLFLLVGCAQVTSLNLRKHQFGRQPSKIYWIQVAGLDSEHWSILKFANSSAQTTIAPERMTCMGQAWAYNLFHLRPNSKASMLSQVLGKKNIQSTCADYTQKPIWYYLGKSNYRTVVIENDSLANESILDSFDCPESEQFRNKPMYFILSKTWNDKFSKFHFSDKIQFQEGHALFDSTCRDESCYLSFSNSVLNLNEKLLNPSPKTLMVIRDFSYQHALEKNNFKKAAESLAEIDKLISKLQEIEAEDPEMLILVTSVAPKGLEFPLEGKEWMEYEQGKKIPQYRSTKLSSSVWAQGARAENFCGLYEESSLLERVLSGPKQQGLEMKIINPFAD